MLDKWLPDVIVAEQSSAIVLYVSVHLFLVNMNVIREEACHLRKQRIKQLFCQSNVAEPDSKLLEFRIVAWYVMNVALIIWWNLWAHSHESCVLLWNNDLLIKRRQMVPWYYRLFCQMIKNNIPFSCHLYLLIFVSSIQCTKPIRLNQIRNV